jgi:hypothetical protein
MGETERGPAFASGAGRGGVRGAIGAGLVTG